jgi:hypothetical protein
MAVRFGNAGWIGLGTLCVLAIPAVAMQFTKEVKWSAFDFAAAGAMLFSAGLVLDVVARRSGSRAYRAGVGVAVGASLLLVWLNLAVGLIGSEDNPANLLYGGVIGVGLAGAAVSRLRPGGMAWTMAGMAVAQALVPAVVVAIWGARAIAGEGLRLAGVTMMFTGLFGVSGVLFGKAGALCNNSVTDSDKSQ